MIRDHFRVLVTDLVTGRGNVVTLDGRDEEAGGSGLAATLFNKYGHEGKSWDETTSNEFAELFHINRESLRRDLDAVDWGDDEEDGHLRSSCSQFEDTLGYGS